MINGTITLKRTGTSSSGTMYGKILWSSESNGSIKNSSTVTATVQVKRQAGFTTTGTWKGSLTVGSTTKSISWYGSIGSNWITVATITVDVAHANDGNGSCYIYAKVNGPGSTSMEGVYVSGSKTINLEKIARYATVVSAQPFTDEENPVFAYANHGGEVVEYIEAALSTDGATPIVEYRSLPSEGGSYTFQLSEAERSALQSAASESNSIQVYVMLRSAIAGTPCVDQAAVTMTVVNAEPVLDPRIVDTNADTIALTGNSSILVALHSVAQVTVNAYGKKQARIVSIRVKHGSAVLESDGILDIVNEPISITVTDSRGNVTAYTAENTIIPYIDPTCVIENSMPNALGEMPLRASGKVFDGSFGKNQNEFLVKYRIRETYGDYGEWATFESATLEGFDFIAETDVKVPDYRKAYVFQVAVFDSLHPEGLLSEPRTFVARPIFDWSQDDFAFKVPVQMGGNRISGLPEPELDADAATKAYVDANKGGGGGVTHKWDGTTLTVTSASGTSSADLIGPEGPEGPRGATGEACKIVLTETTVGDPVDGVYPVISNKLTFSDGTTLTVMNGKDGKTAYQYAKDGGYTGTEAEFNEKLAEAYLPLSSAGYSTPEMYGAIGDGVNDDAGAFTNAINDSDYVFLTSDLYLFTPVAITGKTRLVVDGNGYTINCKNIERALQITGCTNIIFKNIIFNGNSCTTQGVLYIDCENIQVEKCTFKNMTTTSATDGDTWGLNFRDSRDMRVDFCSFVNIDGSGNSTKVANGIVVHGHTKACENITISNCYFDTILPVNDACGISFSQTNFYDTPLYGVVENCLFVDCAKRAVKIMAQYVTVNHCNILDISSNDQHSALIDIMASHCRVTNSTINVNRATNGISCQYVAETSTITSFNDIIIEDNYIHVANEDSTSVRDGLAVGIVDDTKKYTEVTVKNNVVKGRFRYAFRAMYIADSVIDGNTFEGEVRLGNRSLNDKPCNNNRIVNNTMKGTFEASVTHSLLAHNEFVGGGGFGIYFPTYTNGSPSNLRIVGNNFDNLAYGIDGRRTALDNVIITENVFTNITTYDMYLLGTNYVVADNVLCKGVVGTFEVIPVTIPAENVSFSDGETFQEKYDNGDLDGNYIFYYVSRPTDDFLTIQREDFNANSNANGRYVVSGDMFVTSNGLLYVVDEHRTDTLHAVRRATLTGPTGPQGPKGDTGATGPQGPKGDTGTTGPQGEACKIVLTETTVGDPVDGVYPVISNKLTFSDGTTLTVMNGKDGPQGPTGPRGPKGEQGPRGIQGPQGPQGETGPRGPVGPQGPQGLTGKTAYQYAQDGGYTGTEAEFNAKLADEYLPLSGGTMTGELGVKQGGVGIQLGTAGNICATDKYSGGGASRTLLGTGLNWGSDPATTDECTVGHPHFHLELRGQSKRPTYTYGSNKDNTGEMALLDDVNNIQIGGRNLFRNTTTFEGWSLASNITAQDGVITWAATSTLGWNAITNRDAAVKYSEIRDKEVTLSFEVRCAEYAKLNNEPNNGLIANLALFKPGVGSRHAYEDVNYFKHTLSDKWERIEYTFVASDSFFRLGGGVIDPENDNFVIGLYNYSLYSMQIRNVKLERGNKATDWTLAPEDIALRSDNAAWVASPVTVTSTNGVAYTATAPSITAKNLTELKGAKLVIIPNMTSTDAYNVTLNVNGLGAKSIKRWDNTDTSEFWSFTKPGWFKEGYPVTVTFNGTYWMIEGMNKPYASDLQGAVPIEKGGTGATTVAGALANLGIVDASSQLFLLWANASPNSNFAAQTVSIDLSGYSHIVIVSKFQNNADNYASTGFIPVGTVGHTWINNTGAARTRKFTVSASGVAFESGAQLIDASATGKAAAAIPVYIYGTKM